MFCPNRREMLLLSSEVIGVLKLCWVLFRPMIVNFWAGLGEAHLVLANLNVAQRWLCQRLSKHE